MTITVPAALQAHLDETATTTCRLLKIKTKLGVVFGLTSLDQDVPYDDLSGDGEINYVAANGFDPSAMASDVELSVGNAEAFALLASEVPGVTEDMVNAGELDDATWTLYLVNFQDTSMGHAILGAGDLGEVRMHQGMAWAPELLDYSARLKQPVGGVDSRTCRAIYGTAANSQTGCGVDLTALWTAGTVMSIGAEADRVFTGSAAATLIAVTYPSRVQFLTGNNAGREFAVETVDALVFSLLETATYPIEVGETYRHRRDCGKLYVEDCITLNANGINFKGEPYIPVGDAAQGQTPAAQLPGGGGPKFVGSGE